MLQTKDDIIDDGVTLSNSKIGKGAFGVVFAGNYEDAQKVRHKAAIKLNIDPSKGEEFYAESKLVKELNHPNIIKVYKAGKCIDRQQYYCAFEFMDFDIGTFMVKMKKEQGRPWFSEEEAAIIFMDICKAIEYLHRKNICHRDIKPGNIFLDKKMNLKLGDFGLAKVIQSQCDFKNTVVGTLVFSPPEIHKAWGREKKTEYNISLDIWSLGCLLYYLLTGDLYFKPQVAESSPLYAEKAKKALEKPRILPQRLTVDCKNLISSMLAYDPNDRLTIGQVIAHPWFKQLELHDQECGRSSIVLTHCAGNSPEGANSRDIELELELLVKDHLSGVIQSEIQAEIDWSHLATALSIYQDLARDPTIQRDDRETEVLELAGYALVIEISKMKNHRLQFVNRWLPKDDPNSNLIDLIQMSPRSSLFESADLFLKEFITNQKGSPSCRALKLNDVLNFLLDMSRPILDQKIDTVNFNGRLRSLLQNIVDLATFNKKRLMLEVTLDSDELQNSKSLVALSEMQRKKLISKLIYLFDSPEKVARLMTVKRCSEDLSSESLIKVVASFI